jgi:hypothetical protein
LLGETRELVTASFGANAIVAVAQGLIAGIAFWLLGMGAPVFWGVFTAFCSCAARRRATMCGSRAGTSFRAKRRAVS